MLEQIAPILKGLLLKDRIVVMVAAMPFAEMRAAIPLALTMGIPLKTAMVLSVVGNLLPVVPVLFLLDSIFNKARNFRLWVKFFDWFFKHKRKRTNLVEKLETAGLMFLVAIPGVGVWPSCIVASLLRIRFRWAFSAIFLGTIITAVRIAALVKAGKVLI